MASARNVVLPGNPRYQPKTLQSIFGYDNLYIAIGEVEIATLEVLADIGVIPQEDFQLFTSEMRERILAIPTLEVDELERAVTKHDIRAWVQIAQDIAPKSIGRWLHVPLTSYDALDTARTLQFSRAHRDVIKPALHEVIGIFSQLAKDFADHVQIGRTHGQHALPITVGFWFATILNRVLYNAEKLDSFAQGLVGKISGAVGAYNAQVGLGFMARCGDATFEERVLGKLGLLPAPISTQILPPDPLSDFLYFVTKLTATFAQFARDGRHLMRSEIGEIAEAFEEGQVGSSTMAHKRNPKNLENFEGMWLRTKNEFGKVFDALISEHQRDLVGSSLARDFPIIVVNLMYQLTTLLQKDKAGQAFLSKITVDREACKRNFLQNAHLVLAEPMYIALQMAGYDGDAHELVNRRAVPISTRERIPLTIAIEMIAQEDLAVRKALDAIPDDIADLLHSPERYIGSAREKALEIAEIADGYLERMNRQ